MTLVLSVIKSESKFKEYLDKSKQILETMEGTLILDPDGLLPESGPFKARFDYEGELTNLTQLVLNDNTPSPYRFSKIKAKLLFEENKLFLISEIHEEEIKSLDLVESANSKIWEMSSLVNKNDYLDLTEKETLDILNEFHLKIQKSSTLAPFQNNIVAVGHDTHPKTVIVLVDNGATNHKVMTFHEDLNKKGFTVLNTYYLTKSDLA